MNQPVVTVMGDLNYELSYSLNTSFETVTEDLLEYGGIQRCIGGTAANFAEAALQHFSHVYLIGRVGDDGVGTLVVEDLRTKGIDVRCVRDAVAASGIGIHIRDSAAGYHSGKRLLLVQHPSANDRLTVQDVESCRDCLEDSDLLVLDGYCVLSEPRRSASLRAMELAHDHGATVWFDVVPHTAHTRYGLDELRNMTKWVDIVSVEVRTIRHFLDVASSDIVLDQDTALETARIVSEVFEGKLVVLWYGVGNADETLYCWPESVPEHAFTGYRETNQPRGFGDRHAARILPHLLTRLRNPVRP